MSEEVQNKGLKTNKKLNGIPKRKRHWNGGVAWKSPLAINGVNEASAINHGKYTRNLFDGEIFTAKTFDSLNIHLDKARKSLVIH